MNIVLLSGGSGKRLWPLSNDIRSKQFIPLFKEGDRTISMAERVYSQVRAADKNARIMVATARTQVSAIRAKLGDVLLSVEPSRRDTFPAIALACARLVKAGADLAETVAICPVDPYVRADYFAAVKKLTELAKDGAANLYLMGIEPTYPSAKYGYIMPKNNDIISEVASFREKPAENVAQNLINEGALWNSGVFAFRLAYILERAQELLGAGDYDTLLSRYDSLNKISFDYAVAEHEKKIMVMRYHGEWKDIGTWNTLAEVMQTNSVGRVIMEKSDNTQAINELDIPLLVMGAQNLVVAASPDGVLVADKNQSSYIKPLVEKITQPIMYAEKSWGAFKVIDVGKESLTIKVTLNSGHAMNYHRHARRREVWSVTAGTGEVTLDGMRKIVSVGDVVEIPQGAAHTVRAHSDMTLIEVQLGTDISADDKEIVKNI